MARCEVCGFEQFPANTVIRYDAANMRRFFCSYQHAEQWNEQVLLPEEPEPREEQWSEEDLEAIEGQVAVEEALREGKADLFCGECGFKAKNEAGLAAHVRAKHK